MHPLQAHTLDSSLVQWLALVLMLDSLHCLLNMQEHYGKDNEESIQAIKGVYNELELESVFRDYEQASHERLSARIGEQKELPAGCLRCC